MLKRMVLELGGNNALIVLDDADVEPRSTTPHSARCSTKVRSAWRPVAIWSTSLADEYVERLAAYAKSLVVGNPRSPTYRLAR